MRITKTKVASVIAGTAVVALAGTGAMAYWTATGSGTGTAATAPGTSNLTVTQTAAPSNLAPGIAAGAIKVDVTNNAANKAFVSQVVVSIASITSTGACDASDYTLTGATMIDGAGELASGGVAHFSGASLAFNDKSATNQDGCKGATVNLAYAVS
jgi:hypothetical protein